MPSGKWRPFCFSLNVLSYSYSGHIPSQKYNVNKVIGNVCCFEVALEAGHMLHKLFLPYISFLSSRATTLTQLLSPTKDMHWCWQIYMQVIYKPWGKILYFSNWNCVGQNTNASLALTLNKLNCFEDYERYIHIQNYILDLDEIISGTAIHVVCPTQPIRCLPMHWRLYEPAHQPAWYWPLKAKNSVSNIRRVNQLRQKRYKKIVYAKDLIFLLQ